MLLFQNAEGAEEYLNEDPLYYEGVKPSSKSGLVAARSLEVEDIVLAVKVSVSSLFEVVIPLLFTMRGKTSCPPPPASLPVLAQRHGGAARSRDPTFAGLGIAACRSPSCKQRSY
jgi:hypothetical protein